MGVSSRFAFHTWSRAGTLVPLSDKQTNKLLSPNPIDAD